MMSIGPANPSWTQKKLFLNAVYLLREMAISSENCGSLRRLREQRVRGEVGPCKEAMFNAVPQHAKSRSFVAQDRVCLRDFIGPFRVSHSALLNLVFQIAQ